MTKKEHRARHKRLHEALDELIADFMANTGRLPVTQDVLVAELMAWSAAQTHNPTKPPERPFFTQEEAAAASKAIDEGGQ